MKQSRRHFVSSLGRAALGAGLAGAIRPGREPAPPLPGFDDPDFWRVVRLQYPLTFERVYLNTGGLGPAPYAVLAAVEQTTRSLQALSETGHHLIEETRPAVAAFLGADPDEIAFTRNATEGNATVAMGLDLRPGDEVIFESHAHPGGSFPWMARQKEQGIRVRLFEPDPTSAAGNLERIEALITPRTRVIQVSHVTAPTGIRFPVEDIARLARERGLWFHIDGAQAAGMIPVDLHAIGCDSFATSGHKWMGGPHGTGVLYVRRDRLDAVRPTETGAYGDDGDVHLPDRFGYHASARRYEVGTRDAASVVGLGAAVRFLETIGMARVAERARTLARYLQDRLRALPGVTILTPASDDLAAAMTTIRVEGVPYRDLYRYLLQEHGLRCRIVSERGLDALRISTHIFNQEDECERVAEAVRRARDLR
ncbi:MAG: hypothetical protein KatS3mg044_1301 [Rhodothermaceae bacterium]|nr:MAG: hypothetical protein KatS3mg044_1301 [Rhodothermaceae bacterium]